MRCGHGPFLFFENGICPGLSKKAPYCRQEYPRCPPNRPTTGPSVVLGSPVRAGATTVLVVGNATVVREAVRTADAAGTGAMTSVVGTGGTSGTTARTGTTGTGTSRVVGMRGGVTGVTGVTEVIGRRAGGSGVAALARTGAVLTVRGRTVGARGRGEPAETMRGAEAAPVGGRTVRAVDVVGTIAIGALVSVGAATTSAGVPAGLGVTTAVPTARRRGGCPSTRT